MDEFLSVQEAQQKLLRAFTPVGVSRISLAQASGRVLAEDIQSPIQFPSFANSSMDGFAVRADDLTQASTDTPVILEVIGEAAAGKMFDATLQPGQAVRIMTGAAFPSGADAIIPIEDTDQNFSRKGSPIPQQVSVYRKAIVGEYVRPAGQDFMPGQIVLRAKTRLRPQDIGLLALLGMNKPNVYKRPRVALLSTGSELVSLGAPLPAGRIYDSNGPFLSACVKDAGGEPVELGIAEDKMESVQSLLNQAISAQVDLIITSAGVSVGAYDYVRDVIEQNGRLDFWKVNVRPGKPLAFGNYRGVKIIGLPGNPVSAFIGFELFARPAIMKMGGADSGARLEVQAVLEQDIESDGRESYLRAAIKNIDGQWVARLTGHQGSGNLLSLVQANALLVVPAGVRLCLAGTKLPARLLDGIFSDAPSGV